MSESATLPDTIVRTRSKPKKKDHTRQMPYYHVILLNDNDHTYEYVINMLLVLFGHPVEKGFLLAKEVDTRGRVIVDTTTLERAELKRDQIHAFGKDPNIERCAGSMSAIIEPAE